MTKQYLFLDIETTGLNPYQDAILEISWAITDDRFNPLLGSPRSYIVDHEGNWGRTWSLLNAAPTVVRDMHTLSGLVDAMKVDGEGQATLDEIYEELYRDITESGRTTHLAGFSVEFDREFLRAVAFGALFDGEGAPVHHRLLNLSSAKLLLDSAGADWGKASNDNPHRAIADVQESIAQARIFLELFETLPSKVLA